MNNTIISVEGGIGHHFNMSLVFKKFRDKYPDFEKDKLIIMTPWMDVFKHNPHINKLIPINDVYVIMDLMKELKNNYSLYNPSIYREAQHLNSNKHIKEILCENCNVGSVKKTDQLEYYTTDDELDIAEKFKKELTDGRLLGLIQIEGSGIGENALAPLKKYSIEKANSIIKKTSDKIAWAQIRTDNETELEEAEFNKPNINYRKLFALGMVADLGLGTDTLMQHIISGVNNKPFIMLYGRSKFSAYAHPSCIGVGNPDSCKYFECEFPRFSLDRLCANLDCMKSITEEQIIKEIDKLTKNHKVVSITANRKEKRAIKKTSGTSKRKIKRK